MFTKKQWCLLKSSDVYLKVNDICCVLIFAENSAKKAVSDKVQLIIMPRGVAAGEIR